MEQEAKNCDYETIKSGNVAIFMMFDMTCDIIRVNAKDNNFAIYLEQNRKIFSTEEKAEMLEIMFDMKINDIIEDIADTNKKMDIFTKESFIKKLAKQDMSEYMLSQKAICDIAYGAKRK